MAPTQEEWEAWKDHPISQWVFKALREGAQAQRQAWTDLSWGPTLAGQTPRPDPSLSLDLLVLKTRADAYLAPEQTPYEALCEMNGDEPQT